MKSIMIALVLSVSTLGHFAEAQDGKSLRTQTQIAEQLMASLPTQDNFTEPTSTVLFSKNDLRLISMLPTQDITLEIPTIVVENVAVAKSTVIAPSSTKTEVKNTTRADK
ncbi:MAG TPA: hypothetical protein DCR35_09340 [Runella sp.]|nr:hypothetical protein [Runella sp.]